MAKLLANNASEYASLSNWSDAYPTGYASDLERVDSLGTNTATRANMYNALYYLLDSYEDHGASNPAPHWRSRPTAA